MHESRNRADDTHRFLSTAVLHQGVEAILGRQNLVHAPVNRQQACSDDTPLARLGLAIEEIVRIARHVRAMKSADAEVDDAGGYGCGIVRRQSNVARQLAQRRA